MSESSTPIAAVINQHRSSDIGYITPTLHSSFNRSLAIIRSTEIPSGSSAENEQCVATALDYCKTRVLVPYLRVLSVVGLMPLFSNSFVQRPKLNKCINYFYLSITLCILSIGYVLQYLACLRRDRGPKYAIHMDDECPGQSIIFNFFIPSLLNLATYIYCLYLFRMTDNENLQNLMERLFVVSCSSPGEGAARPRRLARSLWLLITLAIIWLVVVSLTSAWIIFYNAPTFHHVETNSTIVLWTLRSFLFFGTLVQDIFQATIVSGYCLQAQLLYALAMSLKQRVLQRTLTILDWMREIKEFSQLLQHLNRELAPAVCILGLVTTSWALSAAAWFLGWTDPQFSSDTHYFTLLLPIILWSLVTLFPFIQAARITSSCKCLRRIGHNIRSIPFVYQNTSSEELDSLLLFSSSLKLNACLCGIPISSSGLWIVLVIATLITLTLGQIHGLPTWPTSG